MTHPAHAKGLSKHARQFCNNVLMTVVRSKPKQLHLNNDIFELPINQAANALKGGKMQPAL